MFWYLSTISQNLAGQSFAKIKMLKQKKTLSEIILTSAKRKPNLIETDRGKEFYNNTFQNFLNNNNIRDFSINRSLGAVFAERFICTIRDLLKRPVIEKRDGN